MERRKIVVSCEHAGKYIPKQFESWFKNADELLDSHRGWDIAALDIGKNVARHLEAPFYFQKVSRLLIEANRSLDNKELFSSITMHLPQQDKQYLIDHYYLPYRNEVEEAIANAIANGQQVVHISVHTFTPVLNGIERTVDIGILYDEAKGTESAFAHQWQDRLSWLLPNMCVMRNVPYNGADDGFTTYLRTKFKEEEYCGIELEVNQKFAGKPELEQIKKALVDSLRE